MRSEIVDCFKVLLLDFVLTCLIVLADVYVLICWQLNEMFGNYPLYMINCILELSIGHSLHMRHGIDMKWHNALHMH